MKSNITIWREIVEVARLYFEEGASVTKIKSILGISSSKVYRYIDVARKEKLIKVIVKRYEKDEEELKRKFGLIDAVVIPTSGSKIKDALGMVAARFFEELLINKYSAITIGKNPIVISLSCGETLYAWAQELDAECFHQKPINVYPLVVGDTPKIEAVYPSSVVNVVAAKYIAEIGSDGLNAYPLWLPTQLNKITQSIGFSAIEKWGLTSYLNEAKKSDIMMIGIGLGAKDSKFVAIMDDHEIEREHYQNAAGEIAYQPFDQEGNPIEASTFQSRLLAVCLEDIKNLALQPKKHVIAVAGGSEKIGSIRAALKGNLFNVLITCRKVANALLEAH